MKKLITTILFICFSIGAPLVNPCETMAAKGVDLSNVPLDSEQLKKATYSLINKKFGDIRLGYTKEQVESVLGKAQFSYNGEPASGLDCDFYGKPGHKTLIQVVYKQGKLYAFDALNYETKRKTSQIKRKLGVPDQLSDLKRPDLFWTYKRDALNVAFMFQKNRVIRCHFGEESFVNLNQGEFYPAASEKYREFQRQQSVEGNGSNEPTSSVEQMPPVSTKVTENKSGDNATTKVTPSRSGGNPVVIPTRAPNITSIGEKIHKGNNVVTENGKIVTGAEAQAIQEEVLTGLNELAGRIGNINIGKAFFGGTMLIVEDNNTSDSEED